ncbi:MAG: DUF4328 domain-containing protein [Actinomycetes bacterium]
MCGWPSGVGYPPADGELERAAVAAPADAESAPVDNHDHVGVQLDALAGMVARQGQPLAPVVSDESSEASASPAGSEPAAPAPANAVVTDQSQESDEAPPQSEPEEAAGEIDPLTAPLSALTEATPSQDPQPSRGSHESDPADIDVDSAHDPGDHEAASVMAQSPGGVSEEPVHPAAPARAAAILRPAQILLVGTAVVNLVVIALGSVLNTSGSSTGVVLGLALLTLALWTGAAVTFLHWISRAHSHVAATAASRQRHGASMSLLGWFIPIAGFVIGYRVLQDLWTGSDPATRDQVDAAPAKARMIDIWLLGIVTAALFGYLMPLALGDSAIWAGVSGIGLLVAALGLVSTMGTISDWQSAPDSDVANPETQNLQTPRTGATELTPATPEPVSVAAE